MVNHIGWQTAPFLWDEALKDNSNKRFKQPAILRFDTDAFMEELADQIGKDPLRLKDYVARYEVWTDKKCGWLSEGEVVSSNMLKLYQPTHGFFYLIATSLVCRIPGLPDRKVNKANEEKASFVIRRVVPDIVKKNPVGDTKKPTESYTEYAWVVTGESAGWMKASSDTVLDEEERVPLFPVNFMDKGKKRRLFAGLIPVSNRERYESEPKFNSSGLPAGDLSGDKLADSRMALFETRIIDALENLREELSKKNKNEMFKFSWDDIPGISGSIFELNEFLNQNYSIDWAGTGQVIKNNNDKTIKISKGRNYLTLDLSTDKSKVNLKIDDGRTDELKVKMENRKPIVYKEFQNLNYDQSHEVFFQIINDMIDFFKENMEDFWTSISTGKISGLNDPEKTFLERLKGAYFSSGNKWIEILKKDSSGITLVINNLSMDDIIQSINYLSDPPDNDLNGLRILVKNILDKKSQKYPGLAQFENYVAQPLAKVLVTLPDMKEEQVKQMFLFIVLDLAQFLNENIKNVWDSIGKDEWTGIDDGTETYNNEKNLYELLKKSSFYGDNKWDDALREIWDKKTDVISGDARSPMINHLTKENIEAAINGLDIKKNADYRKSSIYSDILNILSVPRQISPEMTVMPGTDPTAGAIFLIRCVYDRPKCKNISFPVVSDPSQPFQFASFFDPDAPARPVKIPMPVDTSIEGLRKFPKNVSFLISNKLRQQMDRVQGVKLADLDKGNIKGEDSSLKLGMICSFSIPIITICALILLMIIVQLLNIIFWWLPFFRICLPISLKK